MPCGAQSETVVEAGAVRAWSSRDWSASLFPMKSEGSIRCSLQVGYSGLPPSMVSASRSKQPQRQEVEAACSLRLGNWHSVISIVFYINRAVTEPRFKGKGHRSPLSVGDVSKDSGAMFTNCCKNNINTAILKWSRSRHHRGTALRVVCFKPLEY